jgi:hypothetical protein
MANCLPCEVGYHQECPDLYTDSVDLDAPSVGVFFVCCCGVNQNDRQEQHTRAHKDGADMKDVESTGRKRAALVKPILPGDICEWAWLKFAGGGVKPIVGCKGNPAQNIHHGPDKSVLNNDPETNLHKVCPNCHNRWHTLNDKHYGERPASGEAFLPIDKECLPHDKETKATQLEIDTNEVMWAAGAMGAINNE